MTEPTQGKFASQDDVTSLFEGTFPSSKLPLVVRRIGEVERVLMFQVPSLRKTIEEITADSIAAGDPDRVERVKDVIAEKVLDIHRNPGGQTTQHSVTTPDITTSRAWSPDPTRGRVQFSASDLDMCRLHTRRQRFGTIHVAPGYLTC